MDITRKPSSLLRNRRFWIGIGISLLLLFFFLYQTDLGEIGQALAGANYYFLIPALVVYLFGVLLRAVRWQYLLKPLKNLSPFRLFPLIVIGFLVNNVLPARLGIVARAIILGERENMSKMATGGTMVVEQVLDGVTLLFFVAVISLFVSLGGLLENALYVSTGLFLGVLVLCFMFAFWLALSQRGIVLAVRLLPKMWRGKTREWLIRLVQGLSIIRSPVKFAIIFALSTLVWFCEGLTLYIVTFAFDLKQPFYVLLLATSVANLAWALLVTPGGLGSFDLACQRTLTFFGVGTSVATSYVLVLHALILLPTSGLGLLFLGKESISLAKVMPQQDTGLASSSQLPEEEE